MDSIEGIKIECDEDGFHLILEGDFVDTFERYLANDSDGSIEVRLPQDVGLKLANIECEQIREWWREGMRLGASYIPSIDPDDCGYERDDPKHRDFHSLFAGEADDSRKQAKEGHWPKWNTEAVEDAAKKEFEQLKQRERQQYLDHLNPPGRPT